MEGVEQSEGRKNGQSGIGHVNGQKEKGQARERTIDRGRRPKRQKRKSRKERKERNQTDVEVKRTGWVSAVLMSCIRQAACSA